MEVDEVGARRRDKGGEQAEQLEGSHHQVGGAVGGGTLELVGEAVCRAGVEPASSATTPPILVGRPAT